VCVCVCMCVCCVSQRGGWFLVSRCDNEDRKIIDKLTQEGKQHFA
jgi:hypothetical protein